MIGAVAIGAALLWSGVAPVGSAVAEAPLVSGSIGKFIATDPPVSAPVAEFTDSSGAPVTLASFKGHATLVNLWATWCAPCVHEMPSLDRLQQVKGGTTFAVVTISEDRQGSAVVDPFFEKYQLAHLGRYLDPKSAIGQALKIRGLPTTLLLDRDGRELGRLEGGTDWTSPEVGRLIDWAQQQGGGATDAPPPKG
ncbi:MAG TPA: TlpA disulfide reductase family protein [Stellaceae bacterium]|nr:TlpA disulfide reductase family protein [Stellaceae bacterium]